MDDRIEDRDTRECDELNKDRLRSVRDKRIRNLRRALVAGGYLVTRTSAGAHVVEDTAGAPIALLRVLR